MIIYYLVRQIAVSNIIDPRGRPTITAGSDHYFHTCQSHPKFQNLASNINLRVQLMITTEWTVSLAKGNFDDSYLVSLYFSYI